MTPIAEALKKEDEEEEHLSDKKEYWQNELKSLGIEPKRHNDLNDKAELEAFSLCLLCNRGLNRQTAMRITIYFLVI
jgi:hypothetical protein